jgi:hypothetical protein
MFAIDGWTEDDYWRWTRSRAHDGTALIVLTSWRGECCYRICLVNPLTTLELLQSLLADMLATS